MLLKSYNNQLNKFLFNLQVKKRYKKKLIDLNTSLLTLNAKNYKKLYSMFYCTSYKGFGPYYDPTIKFIIDISFSQTNTLLHIMDFSGTIKLFYSAGCFKFKGKNKKSRFLIIKEFYKFLVSKLKFLKFVPIALHLKNVRYHKFWIIKKMKKRFFIKIVKIYNLYSYNGCKRRKRRRKKIK